jgi:hypothetical protein
MLITPLADEKAGVGDPPGSVGWMGEDAVVDLPPRRARS